MRGASSTLLLANADAFILPAALVLVAGCIWLIVWAMRRDRRIEDARCKRLRAVATKMKLPLEPVAPEGFGERYPELSWMRIGRDQQFTNVISQTKGDRAGWWAFDYRMVVADGRPGTSSARPRMAVLMMRGMRALGTFSVRPAGFLDRLKDSLGVGGIEHPDEAFRKRFHVRGDDADYAIAGLPPETVAYLLEHTPRVIVVQGDVVAVLADGPLEADQLFSMLAMVTTVMKGLPSRSP